MEFIVLTTHNDITIMASLGVRSDDDLCDGDGALWFLQSAFTVFLTWSHRYSS